ncbi:MAG TPA: hypothetical protein VFK62_11655 [Gaiellaceae bacterium]|nr:hypothetical protein [Gaiellaceae bacterium]
MQGYNVIGSDDHKLGEVAAVDDDLLIVEGGLLRKSRHAVPLAFAHADESEQVVRLSVSKEVVNDSPPLENGEVDRQAVALHYGLVQPTEVDPDSHAEEDALRGDVDSGPMERARIRAGGSEPGPHGRQIIPPDAHDKV